MQYDRLVIALSDEELERFTREWIAEKKAMYFEVKRFGGAGDLGRDVAGFLTPQRHEGPWHNYQCKQYRARLPTGEGVLAVGKVLYFAQQGEFTAPERFSFVAPKGLNRNLQKMVDNPGLFKSKVIDGWDEHCSEKIADGRKIALTAELRTFIDGFDFSRIERLTLDEMLEDPHVKPVLFRWFGADPGPAPRGVVPSNVAVTELRYLRQLLDAYEDRDSAAYTDHSAVADHPHFAKHLALQRERFYDAAAFQRYYRDNTSEEVLATFENDMFHGVVDSCDGCKGDALDRVDEVMKQAASVQTSGPLAPHARVPVRQGICHHFANADRLTWRRR